MGKRKFHLSVQRKNHERRKWRRLPLAIPLAKGGISTYMVSIPRSSLTDNQQQLLLLKHNQTIMSSSNECHASELHCQESTTFTTLTSLHALMKQRNLLLPGWKSELSSSCLHLYQLSSDTTSINVTKSISVSEDFSYSVSHRGSLVNADQCSLLKNLPTHLTSVGCLQSVMQSISQANVCIGNPDDKFLALPSIHDGIMKDRSRTSVAACILHTHGTPSLHHVTCEVLVKPSKERCASCSKHRNSLRAIISHKRTDHDRTNPSSHTRYAVLKTPEKEKRLKRLHNEAVLTRRKLQRLNSRIEEDANKACPNVDEDLDQDLRSIMMEHDEDIVQKNSEDSFKRIFWEQQKRAASLKNSKSMRWHPLFIKWCLFLRHLSGKSYELLRNSECIQLPSQRTLRDYTHYTTACIGFSHEVDQQLKDAVDKTGHEERNRYINLVMDEVHIKDDLVYDKHNWQLIGYQNLGDINNHLLRYEAALSDDSPLDKPIAQTMLVFMVRGLFTKLEFPYAQLSCSTLTGELLVDPLWEAVARLERQDVRVLALTCDGASPNRRLWKIHSNKDTTVMYKVNNIYAHPMRPLYFISDPSHLIKTTRNCWWSNKRNLWCNGKQISWRHLVDLYQKDTKHGDLHVTGLRLVPKLKYEHIYLSSFSKMRVELATQVLSETVSKALKLTGGDDVSETAKFALMFDHFFDCLNVNNLSSGRRERKAWKDPYRSSSDFRLKWLKEDFLGYLKNWEQSVSQRKKFTDVEKGKMLLSRETRYGIEVTVRSFVELTQYLFTIPGVKLFLSERLSQDPLEKFFGCQRQRGGTADDPSVAEFLKNTNALRVINTTCCNVSRGNCKVKSYGFNDDIENEPPLPKRRQQHK